MAPTPAQRSISRFWIVPAFGAAILLSGAGLWRLCARNPGFNFLPARAPAQWIVYPAPPHGNILPLVELSARFQRSFRLETKAHKATLRVRGFKQFTVQINGHSVAGPMPAGRNWKDVGKFDVTDLLTGGTNSISVVVSNLDGPPALWLSLIADEFGLTTDEMWEASLAGAVWRPVRLASKPMPINQGNPLSNPENLPGAVLGRLATLSSLAALSAGFIALAVRFKSRSISTILLVSAIVLAIGRLILSWNNNPNLPKDEGFDADMHLSYIEYVLDHASLPTVSEGWEMYQPPLYYVMSALQLAALGYSTADARGVQVLRLFGAFYGIIAFVMVLWIVRLLFPDRPQRQFFGLLIAALMPASIYLSHYVTNEIPATTLVAVAMFLCLRIFANATLSLGSHAWLGLTLGAALLTKSSALLPVAIIFLGLIWNAWRKSGEETDTCAEMPARVPSPRTPGADGKVPAASTLVSRHSSLHKVLCLATVVLLSAAVAGWHYYRVASKFGHPLIGNWDPASGFKWWQHPGYRTSSYYFHFGQSLVHPLGSSFASFCDGVYSTLWGDGLFGGRDEANVRPPWNYDLMAAGYVLALLPTAAILTGFIIMLIRFFQHPRRESFVLLGVALLVGTALIYYSLKIPSYASPKAFYAGSAFVPVCVFGGVGWDYFWRKTGKLRWLLGVVLSLWALNTYASFWIRGDATATRIHSARILFSDGKYDQGFQEVSKVLRQDPRNTPATLLQVRSLIHAGYLAEARARAEQALRQAPDDAESHLVLGMVLAKLGLLDQAIHEARKAIELTPDYPAAISNLSGWLAQTGRNDEAVLAVREVLRINPMAFEFHYRLAASLAEHGDYTNALTHFRLASELNPDWAQARQQMEAMQKKLGNAGGLNR